MSAAVAPDTPLGGFEQRLLAELRAQVAAQSGAAAPQTVPSAEPSHTIPIRHRLHVPRLTAPLTAAIAALTTGLLTLLPAATPALARVFPVLGGPTRVLPSRLARVLRAQWRSGTSPSFDVKHAYAFRTPAGTGYVIVDRRTRWLCILVPALSSKRDTGGGRCERVTLARLGQPPLTVRQSGAGRSQEIIALLPRGATASARTTAGQVRWVTLHAGVLAVVSHGRVTVTTTLTGRHSVRRTYMP